MGVKSKDRASAHRNRPTFRSRHRSSSSLNNIHLDSVSPFSNAETPKNKLIMADDTAMGSLLAAVAVAAATSTTNPQSHHPPPSPKPTIPHNPIPNKLAPISIPKHPPPPSCPALPPPPPPLPPPLPSPPPLPPIVIRKSHPQLPSLSVHANITTNHPSPSSPPSSDKKKGARIFSANEKTILEANYSRNKFPSRLHMETLANAMAKPTEKVRTWYNNRRALDRKLGFDVNRNHFYNPNPPSTHPIILPPPHRPSPHSPTQKPPLHIPSPVSVPRPPPISPLTTPRNPQLPSSPTPSSSPPNPPPKSRTSPLRIRNVSLRIGSNHICGEIPGKPAADTGLEVKFLFGKKRIVYEWYCGLKYSEAQNTGGPYAKMEMNFATIAAVHIFPNPPNTVITFSFSAFPTLFLQTHESMTKYRVRAQQRQYRKVSHQEFPIPVSIEQHTISLNSDEANRILRLLREEGSAISFHNKSEQREIADREAVPVGCIPHTFGVSKKGTKPRNAPHAAHLSERIASPSATLQASVSSGHTLNDRKGLFALQNRHVAGTGAAISSKAELKHEGAVTARAPPPQAVEDIARQTSSYSPVTPAALTAASEGPKMWLTPRPSGFQHTPGNNAPRVYHASPDRTVGQVRRELNFERTPRQTNSHARIGEKRSSPATPFDEVCPNLKTRRKLESWELSRGTLPTNAPSQNHAGRDVPPKHELQGTRPRTHRDDSRSSLVDSQSILRVLPR